MDRYIGRRSIAIAALTLTIVLIAAGVIALVAPRLAGHTSTGSRPASRAWRAATPPAGTSQPEVDAISSPPSVRLATQDLTPAAHFNIMASGFGSREQLLVTIEDMQGHQYEQVTLVASARGDLATTQLTPPQQLGSGDYQLTVAGSESHRTASVTFHMHDNPPSFTLQAYYAKPGQEIGFAGNGFIAGERVTVYLGPASAPLLSVKATDMGAINGYLPIPTLAPGTYTLTMRGEYSQTPLAVQFNIQSFAPWVVLDRYSVMPGQSIGLIGQDFAPGELVLVYLNVPRGTPVMHLTADTAGQITVQDSWTPSGLSGRNTLVFVGQSSQATATVDFTVQPAPEAPDQPTTTPTAPTTP